MTTTAADPDRVRIRAAERADLFDVVRIENAAFPQPWPFDAFERFLGEPGFLVAVAPDAPNDRPDAIDLADDGGAGVVGYVVADTVPNYGAEVGHVKDFAVHPDRRGRGIGTRLLDRALGTLAGRGIGRVKLEVRESNRGARRLYERFGFERRRTVPDYYDDGEDALVLVADVSDRA